VIFNNFNLFSLICESEGFQLNTNLFETNVLNLSVVLGVLVYYGKAALGDLIQNRKENILRSLQDAENKFKEAEENLSFSKKNFESAKLKAEQIRSQGVILSSQAAKALIEKVEEDITRLKASNLSLIKLEEEKSINDICQKLSQFAISKSIEKINKRINSTSQKKIISQNIEKISIKALAQN